MVVFQGEWRDIGGNKKLIENVKGVKLEILHMGMWGRRYVQSTFFTTQNMDGTRLKLLRLSSCSLFFRSSDHAMSFQHVLHWQPSTMRSQGQADKHCKDVAFDDVFLLDAPFGTTSKAMAKTIKFLRFQDGYSNVPSLLRRTYKLARAGHSLRTAWFQAYGRQIPALILRPSATSTLLVLTGILRLGYMMIFYLYIYIFQRCCPCKMLNVKDIPSFSQP